MVIIPTYNERNNIPSLVDRIRKAVPNELILFVDDNSPDDTASEIRKFQGGDSAIHLMVRSGKNGFASAYLDAMKQVVRDNGAEYIITMDADLSHPPESLPRMLELLQTSSVVIGSRYTAGGGTRDWDVRRHFLSFGANLYARLLTGIPVQDMTSGFVGYCTSMLARIDFNAIRCEGYAFQMEMKFNLYRAGATFCEFPIVFSERHAGQSKFTSKILLEGIKFPIRALASRLAL